MKKKEILQFVMIWMNFDSVMLDEISQRKISTVWSHLCVDSKQTKKTTQLIEQIGGCQNQGMEVGEGSEGSQRYKHPVIK